MQDVVVVGEVKIGQRRRTLFGQRHLLDTRGEPVAKPPEPAATNGPEALGPPGTHARKLVEQREGIGVGVGDAQRLGDDDRAASRPDPGEACQTGLVRERGEHQLGATVPGQAHTPQLGRVRVRAVLES